MHICYCKPVYKEILKSIEQCKNPNDHVMMARYRVNFIISANVCRKETYTAPV